MKHRRLGKTGFSVSEIGMGCWQLGGDFGPVGDQAAREILLNARAKGINFWDTADVYGGGLSEKRIAPVLAESSAVHVVTKVGRGGGLFPDNYSLKGLRDSLEASRERLGVETIDLAQLHCVPTAVLQDGRVFDWMEQLQQEGLIANIGVSVETIEEGLLCLERPSVATLQIIFNLFRQDAAWDLIPEAQAADVGIIVRLPLASGLLSGKFGSGHTFAQTDHRNYNRDGKAFSVGETFSGIPFETGVALVDELRAFVPEGMTLGDLALRWILDHEGVSSVIAGVSKPEQIDRNVAASLLPSLDSDLHAQLRTFYSSKVRPHIRGSI